MPPEQPEGYNPPPKYMQERRAPHGTGIVIALLFTAAVAVTVWLVVTMVRWLSS